MLQKDYSKEATNEYKKLLFALAVSYRDCVMGKQPSQLPENTDFEKLLALAESQAVIGGIYPAVKCSNCPPHILKKWTDKAYLALSKEILFDNELSKVRKEFENAKIRFVPMKGIVIKNFYSGKGIRQFCDYDVLVDESRADEAKILMCSLGYDVDKMDVKEKEVHQFDSVINCKKAPMFNFELHKKLFGFESHPYFDSIWDRIIFDSEESVEGRMSDEDLYLFHVAHFFAHFKERNGAGIRYLADHYVLKQKLTSSCGFDRVYVENVLKQEKMLDFEKYADECVEALFLKEKPDLEKLKPFLENGVHGTLENNMKLGVEKSGKFRFILKLAFPSLPIMQLSYEILRKYPFLLPFCYIHRVFAIAFNKKRRNIAKRDFGMILK
ncbi:MAG: hypothetical protein E7614_02050 [Ruminococcaceae bacterium]|nr:hypothetical protein [Oscillospiraceae bacterium]